MWPGVRSLPEWKDSFPKWRRRSILARVPRFADDPVGLDLLSRMLLFQPSARISAREALAHPWFNDPALDSLKAGGAPPS